MKIGSLFSGAGGLDLGFEQAGFTITWANEFDKSIWATFEKNFPHTILDKLDICAIPSADIPDDLDGIIGGPPCQSWSEAGARRGIEDKRGQVFFEYIRVLEDKQPKFFLAENVQGMLFSRNKIALEKILQAFDEAGYSVKYELLNVVNYSVPQDRKRVIFIGFRKDLNIDFEFPQPIQPTLTLEDSIQDLQDTALPAKEKNYTNGSDTLIPNHEYMIGGFSTMFMSRNRVRSWDEPSFTIQASGRHAPLHPQANKMVKIAKDEFVFDSQSPNPYRRLSVREAARIQTFPDNFEFIYQRVNDGYKMVGNAVPVTFAKAIAEQIMSYLLDTDTTEKLELDKREILSL